MKSIKNISIKNLQTPYDEDLKINFNENDLLENLIAFVGTIIKNKPDNVKGSFIKKITIASTMGVGLEINSASLR